MKSDKLIIVGLLIQKRNDIKDKYNKKYKRIQ